MTRRRGGAEKNVFWPFSPPPRLRVIFCFITAQLFAGEYSHRVWRTQDGLPQNRIQAISQTPDGYLWIGTSGGLVRFDGARFTVFDRSSTPSLRDDSIFSLCPARDGSLWIGTEGGGLLHYNHGAFQAFGADEGLTNQFVQAILEDRGGTLWAGTNRGFFRLKDGKFTRLDGTPELPFVAVTALSQDTAGQVWIGSTGGIFSVENGALRHHGPGTLVARSYPHLQKYNPQVVTEDHEGNLWMGTLGEGLLRFRSGAVTAYRSPDPLPGNSIRAIFEDRERNLWIGTEDGLLRMSKTLVRTITTTDGLGNNNVSAVYQDRSGTVWLTTITGQLYRMRDSRAIPFRLPGSAEARVRTVFLDSKSRLWIGTAGHGVLQITDGRPMWYTIANGLRSNTIRGFHEDRRGNIWIATGSGLGRWDGNRLRTYYIEDGLAYGSVRTISDDPQGDLLVGTDGGLNRIHNDEFVKDPVFASIGSEKIWSIFQGPAGALWLGTRGGGMFRIKNGKAVHLTTRHGLLSNTIYEIVEDGNGRLWMSSPAGIFSATGADLDAVADGAPGPLAIASYGTADGMESAQMNGGALAAGLRTSSGELWFPSVKGVVRIDPRQLRTSHPTPALIETVLADDRSLPVSGVVRVPPGRGKIEIHFTACALLSPERLRFQYRLEDFDERWTTAAPNQRAAYYTNLPAGRYRFRVVASDGPSTDSAREASLSFVLEPHFYRTAWFYAMLAFLAGAMALAGLRFYSRQTKARYALLLAERTRLAREMHDTVIQGCVGVSTLLEAASSVQPHHGGKLQEILDAARGQLRSTLDEARQAVWDLRHDAIHHGAAAGLTDFARQLNLQKAVQVRTEIKGTPVPLDGATDRNLLLIAREAVRNAITHGGAQQIGIRLEYDSGEVSLQITDDGHGFNPPAEGFIENGHYGVIGMRERAEQMAGSFTLFSSPENGTTVRVRVPGGRARQA